MTPWARLNFVLPQDLDSKLLSYQERTGRSPSDVIRHLVVEWLDGSLTLRERASKHPDGRRTNILVRQNTAGALEARVASEGHATVSAVVAALLERWLTARAPTGEETVTLPLRLPLDLANDFAALCTLKGVSPEDALLNHVRERVTKTMTALKESS